MDARSLSGCTLTKPEVTIVDYGAGNLRSVERAVEHVGGAVHITSEPTAVQNADIVVLPGVGAAADTMHNLQERRLAGPIRDYIASGRPFMGICMGLQALMTVSEEGGLQKCLDVLPGSVVRLPEGLKVPHMGWNRVDVARDHPALPEAISGQYFYFVHSYYADPTESSIVAGWTDYGVRFPSIVARDNLIATQFHPEKSGDVGLSIYSGFIKWASNRSR